MAVETASAFNLSALATMSRPYVLQFCPQLCTPKHLASLLSPSPVSGHSALTLTVVFQRRSAVATHIGVQGAALGAVFATTLEGRDRDGLRSSLKGLGKRKTKLFIGRVLRDLGGRQILERVYPV